MGNGKWPPNNNLKESNLIKERRRLSTTYPNLYPITNTYNLVLNGAWHYSIIGLVWFRTGPGCEKTRIHGYIKDVITYITCTKLHFLCRMFNHHSDIVVNFFNEIRNEQYISGMVGLRARGQSLMLRQWDTSRRRSECRRDSEPWPAQVRVRSESGQLNDLNSKLKCGQRR